MLSQSIEQVAAKSSELKVSFPEATGDLASPPLEDWRRRLQKLQGELVKLQEWVKASGAKICIVFEGRDTAGKGGVIKRITERVSPRVFRVVALAAPTEREKSQMYFQRYMPHLPAAGEVVIFDRSWYNRAGVERVVRYAFELAMRRRGHLISATKSNAQQFAMTFWDEVVASGLPFSGVRLRNAAPR